MGPKIKELLLPLAIVVIHMGVCTAFDLPSFFGGGSSSSNEVNSSFSGNVTNSTADPDSKLHILLNHVQPVPFDGSEHPDKNIVEGAGADHSPVPEKEFEKLKSSAKTAGLSEPKADRLVRATKMMNMTADEIADVITALSGPETSPVHADKVRRQLEEAAIDYKTNATQKEVSENHSADARSLNPVNYTLESSGPAGKGANKTIDPLSLDKLAASSTLGGLDPQEAQRLVRALIESNLNSTHVNNLVDAMTQHGPTPGDLRDLTHHLESNRTSTSDKLNLHPIKSERADNILRKDTNLNNTQVPTVEFEKLKNAAKTAGLPDHKAERLMRAAQLMNMTSEEVADANKLLSSPTTSAEHADKVRRQLEEAAIDCETNPTQNEVSEKHSADARSLNPVNSTLESSDPAGKGANKTIDPLSLHKLAASSTVGGLNPEETQRLVRAIIQSNLTSNHVNSLVDAMTQHAPTTADLKNLTQHLESNGTSMNATPSLRDSEGNSKDSNKSDWFDVPLPKNQTGDRQARNESPDSVTFSSARDCGVSRKVLPSKLSNVSPGQYPWDVAILSSDDVFYCAGTLISESIVMTTASCILNYKKNGYALKMVLGAWSFPQDPSNFLPPVEIYSKAAVFHPLYKEGSGDYKHNLGLIRLWDEVNFNHYPHIYPICIVGRSQVDQASASNQCKVQGWPDLQNVDVKRTRSYLTGADVQTSKDGFVTGAACAANEGSGVMCPGSSLRYYQWGIVASQPHCPRGSSTTLATVSIFDNYDFISDYLNAPNPNEA